MNCLSPVNAQLKVLCQLITSQENNNQVNVEFNLEFGVDVRGARVNLRKKHKKGNLKILNHISVRYLNVLYLGSVSFALVSFDANKLNLNRLYVDFTILAEYMSLERLVVAAIGTVDAAGKLEPR